MKRRSHRYDQDSRRPYGKRKQRSLPRRLGSNELFLGAVIVALMAAVKFVTDTSFGSADLLKFMGIAAILLGLCSGFYLLTRSRRPLFTPRRTGSSSGSPWRAWGAKRLQSPGNIVHFEPRAEAAVDRPRLRLQKAAGLAVLAVAVATGTHLAFGPPLGITSGDIGVCRWSLQQDCVIDGDTIRYGGEKIRLVGIDTPEIFSPKCDAELVLGEKARIRLVELMNAGPFGLVPTGRPDVDRYGRKLRVLVRDGQPLGNILVREGLARHWVPSQGPRAGWC